jgi:hypothetical protein
MNKAVACASRKGKYTPTLPLGGGAERLLGVLTPHQKKRKKIWRNFIVTQRVYTVK